MAGGAAASVASQPTPGPYEAERAQATQLEKIWREPSGFVGWFKAVHHTTIGKRYAITAFGFFVTSVDEDSPRQP